MGSQDQVVHIAPFCLRIMGINFKLRMMYLAYKRNSITENESLGNMYRKRKLYKSIKGCKHCNSLVKK